MQEVAAFSRRPYTYLNPAFLTLRRRGGNDPAEPVCRAVSTCVVISPFNELVLPCYHYGLDRLPIDGNLYELWQSDTVRSEERRVGKECRPRWTRKKGRDKQRTDERKGDRRRR